MTQPVVDDLERRRAERADQAGLVGWYLRHDRSIGIGIDGGTTR